MYAGLHKGPKGATYSSVEDYVLKNGQAFATPNGLPKGVRERALGMCYMNAYQLVDARSDLTYVEGFATFRGVPMGHAWAVDAKNNVVDPTWAGKKNHKVDANTQYFGVKMKIDDVRKTIFARGKYGVLYNYEEKFPLLK